MNRTFFAVIFFLVTANILPAQAVDFGMRVIVSARDQQLAVVENGKIIEKYRISTSKFGVGDEHGSYKTPLGTLWVCNKIGDNLKPGTVIKHRNATSEVIPADAPGRDPIVTRIIWLRGLEDQNKNAYERCIYIHGTAEERLIGKKASYGCIRMRSKDIISLYNIIHIGTHVTITDKALKTLVSEEQPQWNGGSLTSMSGD
jgi:lipoprotein-anchoring transpeptidase ErfK/SrfK